MGIGTERTPGIGEGANQVDFARAGVLVEDDGPVGGCPATKPVVQVEHAAGVGTAEMSVGTGPRIVPSHDGLISS